MNDVKSKETVLPAELRPIATALIQLAAEFARRQHCVSPYTDDHPAHARRGYWLKKLGDVSDLHGDVAMRIRAIADSLPRQPR